MWEDTKSVLVLLVAVLVVVGGLFLLGSASGSGSDWSEWYLGWLLYPLYIFVPAGLLWLLFVGFGVVQDRVEEAQERSRKRKTQRQDHSPSAEENLKASKPMGRFRQFLADRLEEME